MQECELASAFRELVLQALNFRLGLGLLEEMCGRCCDVRTAFFPVVLVPNVCEADHVWLHHLDSESGGDFVDGGLGFGFGSLMQESVLEGGTEHVNGPVSFFELCDFTACHSGQPIDEALGEGSHQLLPASLAGTIEDPQNR